MSDPSFALQVALVDLLSTGLEPLGCPVYDGAPLDSPRPYLSIDSEISNAADFLNSRIDQRFLYLSVWSDFQGQQEVKKLMAAVDDLLSNSRLTLDTGRAFGLQIVRKQSQREPDGVTYQGAITLRIYTQH